MRIYVIFWGIIILMCFLEINQDRIKIHTLSIRMRNVTFWVIYLFTSALGVFRYELLGVDSANYKTNFLRYGNKSYMDIILQTKTDWGFYSFNKLIYDLGGSYWMLKSILFMVTLTIVAVIIYKNSKYPAISFLSYFAFNFLGFNFCILRQALAVSICFYAYKYVKEKKLLPFVGFVLLATVIHSTAIIYFLVYPLVNYFVKSFGLLKKIAFAVLAVAFGSMGLSLVYGFYHTDYSEFATAGGGKVLLIAYLVLFLWVRYMLKYRFDEPTKTEYNVLFLTVYIQIVAGFFSLFTRFVYYFAIMLTLVAPKMFENRLRKNQTLMIYVIACSLLYFVTLKGMDIVPYVSVFDY